MLAPEARWKWTSLSFPLWGQERPQAQMRGTLPLLTQKPSPGLQGPILKGLTWVSYL